MSPTAAMVGVSRSVARRPRAGSPERSARRVLRTSCDVRPFRRSSPGGWLVDARSAHDIPRRWARSPCRPTSSTTRRRDASPGTTRRGARRTARRRGSTSPTRRRPARGRSTGGRVALRFVGRHGAPDAFTYADLAELTNRFAGVLAGLGVGSRRTGLLPARPAAGAVRRRARHAQARQRVLPAVLRVRPRAGPPAADARRRAGAGHHPGAVPQEGRPGRAAGCPISARRCSSTAPTASPRAGRATWSADGGAPRRSTRSRATRPGGRRRCCTSRAARPARRRARCTCTRPSSRTTPPGTSPWTCTPTTSTGAPPTPAGSPARPTASSPRSLHGVTSVVDEEEFDAERWYGILAEQRVTVWYTAPTALRMLMQAGADVARGPRPLGAAVRRQRRRAAQPRGRRLGPGGPRACPIHDNWWQTETGGIMIANFRAARDPPRLDGPAAARHRGGARAPRRTTAASSSATARRCW